MQLGNFLIQIAFAKFLFINKCSSLPVIMVDLGTQSEDPGFNSRPGTLVLWLKIFIFFVRMLS